MKLTVKSIDQIKAAIILILIIFAPINYGVKSNQTKYITIFVHGTLLPALAMLNPIKLLTQTLNTDDRYYKCLANIRKNEVFQQDSIMLNEGLIQIDPSILIQYEKQTLPQNISKKAAYQAIGAYHLVTREISNNLLNHDNCIYYTYGFSGALSDKERQKAAHSLYKELIKIYEKYNKENIDVVINLCGYSHGGNILLYLAHAEDTYKQKLKINTLALFATPIQPETAHFVEHHIFDKIINFYSNGDFVQNSDTLSTKSRVSYRTFKELSTITHKNVKNLNGKRSKLVCDVHL